jgi:hypothetical protein
MVFALLQTIGWLYGSYNYDEKCLWLQIFYRDGEMATEVCACRAIDR